MTFIWPDLLWLLLIVPVLVFGYLLVLRRKRRALAQYANLGMVAGATSVGQRFRRHVPPVLLLAALTLMIAAIARPAAVVMLPSQHENVVLAIDVSGSMRATDVKPDRITAAREAAKSFVTDAPAATRIGVVHFAGTASLVQPPTRNREDVLAAIDRAQLQAGTAIGSAILTSLKAIFPDAEFDLRGGESRPTGSGSGNAQRPQPGMTRPVDRSPAFVPVPPGSYESAVIVLLSDGQSNTGAEPKEAARIASERGVKIYTIGVGTPEGEVLSYDGWQVRVRLDEEELKNIAMTTRGEYFHAGSSAELKKVYRTLRSRLTMERRETEVTALFTGAAAALAVISGLLSLLWFRRIL
ncbi:MAG TPA: VWA domain-containing protein [Burkholderiaceae bacterium]|nr:VWA domain-containing protein [Burkholderiaceae bacterium]